MNTCSYKKESLSSMFLRVAIVAAVGYVLLFSPDSAFAQSSGGGLQGMGGLDSLMCNIYSYLAKKVLFYVALIVSIVGILAYLLKMNKEIWGTLFVIALLIGVAQGVGPLLMSLGSFSASCPGAI